MADEKPKKTTPKKTTRKTSTGNVGGAGNKIMLSETDYKKILDLASHMWSAEEIAGFFDMSHDTLTARIKEDHDMTFTEFVKQANNKAKGNLRSIMWKEATGIFEKNEKTGETKMLQKPNGMMQIYLSKNYLGMTDKTDIDLKGNVTITINGKFAEL